MNAKNQKPNLRSEKIQSTSFLIWIISGLYLLPMVWFLLSTMGGYGAHETKPWLVPTVAALTVSYGILMLLLWPHEKVSPRVNLINPVFTLTQLPTCSLLRIVLLLPPKGVTVDVPLYVPGVGASLSPKFE